MKINENRNSIVSGLKVPGKKEGDLLSVKDKVSISSSHDTDMPFYTKTDFTVESDMKTEDISRAIHSQKFDEILNLLSQAVNQDIKTAGHISRADGDVKDSQRELQFSHFDIREVQRDTDKTDVSQTGYRLDRTVRNVENKLSSGDRYTGYASGGIDTTEKLIDDACRKLDSLKSQLVASGGYEQVLGLLEQAKQQTGNSSQQAQNIDRDIYDTDRKLDSASNQMRWAEMDVNRIKMDRQGVNVSSHGYQLDSKVNQVEWDLRDADRSLSNAASGLPSLDNKIGQAVNTLKQAQNIYNSIATKTIEESSIRADISSAKALIEKALSGIEEARNPFAGAAKDANENREHFKEMDPSIKKINLDFIGKDVSAEGRIIRAAGNNITGHMMEGEAFSGKAEAILEKISKDVASALGLLEKSKDEKVNLADAKWQLKCAGDWLDRLVKDASMDGASFRNGKKAIEEMSPFLDIVEMDTVQTDVGRFSDDLKELRGDGDEKMIDAKVISESAPKSIDAIKGYLAKALKDLS
jgi:hypothetical protein